MKIKILRLEVKSFKAHQLSRAKSKKLIRVWALIRKNMIIKKQVLR